MFNNYKELKDLIGKVFKLYTHCRNEVGVCNKYLEDLPNDVDSISEFENMIDNNKDLSRAYDLGRKKTLEELQRLIDEFKCLKPKQKDG